MEKNGRYFHNLTEEKAEKLFIIGGLRIVKIWIAGNVRGVGGKET